MAFTIIISLVIAGILIATLSIQGVDRVSLIEFTVFGLVVAMLLQSFISFIWVAMSPETFFKKDKIYIETSNGLSIIRNEEILSKYYLELHEKIEHIFIFVVPENNVKNKGDE